MTKNNAIFYVQDESGRRFKTDSEYLSIRLHTTMWIRYYAEDGTCTILKNAKSLDSVGITSDQDFEALKALEGRLVVTDAPFFTVRSHDNKIITDPIYYYDEALEYITNYTQSNE